ncbi:MAG: AMP-binding protein [Bacteroidales bacterium]|nr:AMP-binding protein [Bacteroidales bacterium]
MIFTQDYNKPALITRDNKYSYRELFDKIVRFAQIFEGKKYEKIAIYSENREDWVFAFYAGWYNHCTVVPVDFLASKNDVAHIINDCKPDLIFYSNTTKNTFDEVSKNLDYNFECNNFDTLKLSATEKEFNWNVPQNESDIAAIIYTSGTTGKPKGVMLSFKNLFVNIDAVTNKVKIFVPNQQSLLLLPLHHIFPLAGLVVPLCIGGTAVISPGMQSSEIMETLKNNKVNIVIGVPRFYDLLYKGLKSKVEAKLSGRIFFRLVKLLKSKTIAKKIFKKVHTGFGGHIEYFISGGAALNQDVATFFETLGFNVLEGYGMTEASPMITFPRPNNRKQGSVGQALPSMELELRDGEIVAKGANIMEGYYNRPDETAEVLKDGWLHTGDLGRIDKDGFLYITGRKKEIIVLPNGKNINPVELEEKLEKIPCVKEAAVFMNKDFLHALIFPEYNKLATDEIKDPNLFFKETIIPDLNKELTSYKRIMKFSLIKEDIPRTRLGKIQRFKLSEMVDKPVRKINKAEEPDSKEYRVIKSFIENEVDMTISAEDHLEFDIAMDSLGKISLIDFIEKTFGVKIEEDKLLNFPSIRKMVDHIRENKVFQKIENFNWAEVLKEKIHLKLPKTWPTQTFLIKSFRNVFKVYFKFSSTGLDNIPDGPAIIAPNHQSYLDGLFVTASMKKRIIKESYFYAKKKHIKNKFLRFMANRNNVIVMDINNDVKESIQKLAEVLKQKKKVIIFPEGTRSLTGALGDFKKTFAILSKELNVPVVPVAISGAYNALPTGSKFPKPFAQIQVKYLEPIYPKNLSFEKITSEVKKVIANKIKLRA